MKFLYKQSMISTRIIVFLLSLLMAFPAYADINSDLFDAIGKGDKNRVQTLLDNGADVNAKDRDGWAALIVATRTGHVDIVKILLERGADRNAKTKYGNTAFKVAKGKGYTKIIRLLQKARLKAKTKKIIKKTPKKTIPPKKEVKAVIKELPKKKTPQKKKVATAIRKSPPKTPLKKKEIKVEITETAKTEPKKKEVIVPSKDTNPKLDLFTAVEKGDVTNVEVLLGEGAKLDARNKDGRTALMLASWQGHIDVVKVLLDRGANPNAVTMDGRTALILATERGHIKIAELFKLAAGKALMKSSPKKRREVAKKADIKLEKVIIKINESALKKQMETQIELKLDLLKLLESDMKRIVSESKLFAPPQEMAVDIGEKVHFRIGETFMDNLLEGLKKRGTPQIEEIRAGTFIKASLTGDFFDIKAINEEKQPLTSEKFTQWEWDVVPLESGTRLLLIKATIKIEISGSQVLSKDFPLLERSVQVKVNLIHSSANFIKSYWPWITGVIILIVSGIIGWIVISRKKAMKR